MNTINYKFKYYNKTFILTVGILLLSINGGLLSNNFLLRVLTGILSIASLNNLSHISRGSVNYTGYVIIWQYKIIFTKL